jgi:hypothetical protein
MRRSFIGPAAKRHFCSAVVSSVLMLGIGSLAWAGDKEDVAAAAAKWTEAFSDDTPDRIVALYDNDAVLWGTLSPKRRDHGDAIREYMVSAFAALPGHKVAFGDQLIRVYGDTAINTGYYTFSYSKVRPSTSCGVRRTYRRFSGRPSTS